MKNKDLKKIILNKQKNISHSYGWPSAREGRDGDITIRTVPTRGMFLLVKVNGKWFSTRLNRFKPTDAEGQEPLKAPLGKLPKHSGEITLKDGKLNFKTDKSLVQTNITASSTDTLTNKTFDANGTGNSLSNVDMAADVTGTLPAGNGGTGITSLAANVVTLLGAANFGAFKTSLTLNNVSNTADADKPVSDDTATALALKAPIASPVFTGNISSTAMSTFTITGSDDSAASIYIKGGLNNGESALFFYPDKGDDAADKFKIYAQDGATSDGLRFAKMSDAGSGGDGSWVDIMKFDYGGNADTDSTITFNSPLSSDQAIACSEITSGAPIWVPYPFEVTNGVAARPYYRDVDDLYGDFRKWDDYDTSPTAISRGDVAGHYVVPENCTLKHMRAVVTNSTSSEDIIIAIYHGTPNLDTGFATTLTLAGSENTITIGTASYNYSVFSDGNAYIDFDVDLTAGDIIVPMVEHNSASGNQTFRGNITLKFLTR